MSKTNTITPNKRGQSSFDAFTHNTDDNFDNDTIT